jgi:hypothetical protein
MIINYHIEATVLVHNRDQGDNLSERGYNDTIRAVYSKDLIKFGGSRGGLQTTAMYYQNNWPTLHTKDKEYQVS